jgi:hypothetical protein
MNGIMDFLWGASLSTAVFAIAMGLLYLFFKKVIRNRDKKIVKNLIEHNGQWISSKIYINPLSHRIESGIKFFVDPITGGRQVYDFCNNLLPPEEQIDLITETPCIVTEYCLMSDNSYAVRRIAIF